MPRDPDHAPARFPTTRASLILAARQPEFRAEALEGVLEMYWKPLYKYARIKWNRSPEDAQDLTQGFFASLLERDLLARWDPSRASFRVYIRLCFDAFVKNDLTASNRLKRGGGTRAVSLDFENAEREIPLASSEASPEELFHREWQRRMFELAIQDLSRHCEATGRQTQWRIFTQFDLSTLDRPSYEQLAGEHGLPVTTVTNYLSWARRELRRFLLDRIALTAAGADEVRREARDLLHVQTP